MRGEQLFISFPAEHTQVCILKSVFYKLIESARTEQNFIYQNENSFSFNEPVQAVEEDLNPPHEF